MSAARRRAHALLRWAGLAPAWVSAELLRLAERPGLTEAQRAELGRLQRGPGEVERAAWSARFPVILGEGGPEGLDGGLLAVTAPDPGVPLPVGARRVELAEPLLADLWIVGLPPDVPLPDGRSWVAAAWVADRARRLRRPVPDVVISADSVGGTAPRLAAVEHGRAKAAVVAREAPRAQLLVCGEGGALAEGAQVSALEAAIWGAGVTRDEHELRALAAEADHAFRHHAYVLADQRYRELHRVARREEAELRHLAALRLAALAVHAGQPADADAWLRAAAAEPLPPTRAGAHRVEALCTAAGRAIDGFRPDEAADLLDRLRAVGADHPDLWERVQVLGAWRRLHLLRGEPDWARDVQEALVTALADDEAERPRALLDLALVAARGGDRAAARDALLAADAAIPAMPAIHQVQTRAFLAWHAAGLAREGELGPLARVLDRAALDALLAHPELQVAGRWRLRAARDGAAGALAIAETLTPFQRWYLGIYLLGLPGARSVAREVLLGAAVHLDAMPALAAARDRLAADPDADVSSLRALAAY